MLKQRKILGLIICTALLMTGCSILPEEPEYYVPPVIHEDDENQVEEIMVMKGDIADVYKLKVAYEASESSNLCFGISDESLKSVYIKVGDVVKKGDLLATLDTKTYTDETTDLELQADRLEENIAYMDKLMSIDSANKDSYTRSREDYTKELTTVNMAIEENNIRISEREIRADIDGTIAKLKETYDGYTSNENEIFVRIIGGSRNLTTTVGDKTGLEIGKEYDLVSGDYTYVIKLSSIEEKDGSFNLLFDFVDDVGNISESFKGNISYNLSEAKDVLYLPTSAVSILNNESFVYVKNEDGFKTKLNIETGDIVGEYIIVKEGLKEGDLVINN